MQFKLDIQSATASRSHVCKMILSAHANHTNYKRYFKALLRLKPLNLDVSLTVL